MQCSHCKAQIKEGSLYCSQCGRAIQIVPDYNVLEDEVLPAIVYGDVTGGIYDHDPKIKPGLFATKSAKRVALVFAGLFVILIAGFIAIYTYTHSYGFLMIAGREAEKVQNYDRAISYYREAQMVSKDSIEVMLALSKAQIAADYNDEAAGTLLSLLEVDPGNIKAFKLLTRLYDRQSDYDGLDALGELASTKEQKKYIKKYIIEDPVFSLPGGEYRDDVTLFLSAGAGYEIYYTLDGSVPGDHNGIRYNGTPLELTKGSNEIHAVCVRADGKLGRVVSETYTIIYEVPGMPTVYPGGGRLTKPTRLTITTDSEFADIYYTWDGSVPTTSSRKYTDPIYVPEGNSILSVIAIDKHGLTSPVLQVNYIYLP